MAPKDLDNLIAKFLEGKCTEEECQLINSWYASLGSEEAGHADKQVTVTASAARDRMLRNLEGHAGKSNPETTHISFWRYAGIAASIIACLATGYYFLGPVEAPPLVAEQVPVSDTVFVRNTSTEHNRIILPDGSIVQLSPGAGVRYARVNNSQSREIFLTGEAYFDIAHDASRPFYVYAGEVVTRVVGTSFIVRAHGGEEKVTVSVKTGKVTVYSRKTSHKKTVLTPNQEAVYDASTDVLASQPVAVRQLREESSNLIEMQFEETAVSEVLKALTKAYDVKILFEEDDLEGCVLTSSFFEEGLYDRIDVICTAIGATYKIVDTQIVVESSGCNLKPE